MSIAPLCSLAASLVLYQLAGIALIVNANSFFYLTPKKTTCTLRSRGTAGAVQQRLSSALSGAPLANRSWTACCSSNRFPSPGRPSNLDRPKAIENFKLLAGAIRAGVNPAKLPHLIDQLVKNVGVIQATNKHKSPCPDCRAQRLCVKNLAVPIITNCESCDKEIVFLIPVEFQESEHWSKPVSRISDACPRARRKKNFAWCPTCRKYPEQIERINRLKELRKDGDP